VFEYKWLNKINFIALDKYKGFLKALMLSLQFKNGTT